MINITYNGWRNRETWLVNLWFNPETIADIEYIEETLESDFYEKMGDSNIYCDMIDFNAIEWEELKDHIRAEEELEAEYQKSKA